MFEIIERDGLARICAFHTRRGIIETPCLLPVVNPNINTISPKELYEEFGIRAIITNSYIIMRKRELKESAMYRGVHELLDFPGIVMTDSGTFQSHVYSRIDATNKEIVEFQRDIGSDIGMPLDIFTEPDWEREKTAHAITQTVKRTKEASEIKGEMLLGGVIQGSIFSDLREQCAREMSALPVDIHPIGGVVPLMENYRFADLVDVIVASKKGLVPNRPVHLFGAGHPMVFALAVLLGCDTFDSASYAKFARDGRFMFSTGTYRLEDMKKIVCDCPACRGHDIESIKELDNEARTNLIARHNLYESIAEIERIKKAILEGTLWEFVEMRCRSHPALLDGLRRLAYHKEFLEKYEPLSREGAFFYTGPESLDRPSVFRYERRFFERYTQPPTQILVGFEDSDKPYTAKYAKEIEEISAICDAHFIVMSPLGPVPIELDEIYPVAQSVFPKIHDEVLIKRTRQLMERMSHIQKYGM
jgi:7-cyano-7-deazaguanine tRNA-ribosyltransferase